jgi:hypothetical protein
MVSVAVRPKCWWITRKSLWDPVWRLIHEAAAIPFWFVFGLRIDTGRSPLRKTMSYYLMARCGLGLLILGPWSAANVGVLLQFLFWFGLAVYGVVRGVQWTGRAMARIRTSARV